MVDHGHKEIEEQLAALFHFVLHCAAALECVSGSNYESKIVSSQLGVGVGSVGICESSRREYGRALNARLETLLLESKLLQLFQTVLVSLTVDDGIFQDRSDRRLDYGFVVAVAGTIILKIPAVALFIILHARVVVTLVQVLEY